VDRGPCHRPQHLSTTNYVSDARLGHTLLVTGSGVQPLLGLHTALGSERSGTRSSTVHGPSDNPRDESPLWMTGRRQADAGV
jgi:hypothetical protein